MVSGRDSIIELKHRLTPKDVASPSAYPKLGGILIARGTFPSEYAGSYHTLGYQTYRVISHISFYERGRPILPVPGDLNRVSTNYWPNANDSSDSPLRYARQRLR